MLLIAYSLRRLWGSSFTACHWVHH